MISRRNFVIASAVASILRPWESYAHRNRGGGASSGGGGGGTAPIVLHLDTLSVPIGTAPTSGFIPSGMTAATYQGENGAGGYLTIYGANFGTFANLGTSSGARVYINGVEVANYRFLVQTNANVQAQAAGWPFPNVYALGVQVGSTGVQALSLGTAYAVSVVVNGVSSNANDLLGNPITVVLTQSPIFFVNESTGNDTNSGLIASPKQHAQGPASGSVATGILASSTTVSGGQSNGVQGGTQIVMRGGTYTYAKTVANADCYIEMWRVTGCDPTITPTGGAKGVNAGWISVVAYPGAALANAREVPSYTGFAFLFGQDNADGTGQSGTNPYGDIGFSHYICFSGITVAPSSNNIESFMFNIDNNASFWRIVDCDISWSVGTVDQQAAGIAGDGWHVQVFSNYIHDIGGTTMNHGMYLDAEAVFNWDWEVAYNFISNCFGGSCLQTYGAGFTDFPSSSVDIYGHSNIGGVIVHHNCIDGVASTNKYALNWADVTGGLSGSPNLAFCNLLARGGISTLRFNQTGEVAFIYNYNNTIYSNQSSSHGLIENDGGPGTGSSMYLNNNLLVLAATRSTNPPFWDQNGAGTFNFSNNQFFDPKGTVTTTIGTNAAYGDPLITTDWTNFALQSGSPCIGTGTTANMPIVPAYDYLLATMPRAGQTLLQRGAFA